MLAAGTRAPSNTTSPNSLVMPLIILNGNCSIPGWSMGTTKAEMPLCLGTAGSVRARTMHQSASSE